MNTTRKLTLLAVLTFFGMTANATIVFYDWLPDQGEGGEGYLSLDTSGVSDDPANFTSAPLIELSFQFVATGPEITLADFPDQPRLYTAEDGVITSINMDLFVQEFTDSGELLSYIDFTRSIADCSTFGNSTGELTDVCEGIPSDRDYAYGGQWVLREPVSVSSPQTAALLLIGLAAITVGRSQRGNVKRSAVRGKVSLAQPGTRRSHPPGSPAP